MQFDPESPIPKLIFRPNALLDNPDPEYNVDRVLYEFSRKIQQQKRAEVAKLQSINLKSIVAEGDSWFKLLCPGVLFPHAIADRIEKNGKFNVCNIAYWGHTLRQIAEAKEYMSVMKEKTPDFFLLSAGGNDLLAGFAEQDNDKRYVHEYEVNRKNDDYLTEAGKTGINAIGTDYQNILNEVTKDFPDLKVFCHGYDYPRICPPKDDSEIIEDETKKEEKTEFIGKNLDFLGIPYDEMDDILRPIINKLNEKIEKVVESYKPQVEFIDLRGVASKTIYDWIDDIHPGEEGFKALAAKFENAMSPPGLVV